PSMFVKRQLELKVKFNCKYNYKQALCKDSGFCLVENTNAKYSILDKDTYNFNKSRFIVRHEQGWP
ncbi:uncharacterized protein M421DRAFT_69998, partial [Didymella exigua CBS 183.55]